VFCHDINHSTTMVSKINEYIAKIEKNWEFNDREMEMPNEGRFSISTAWSIYQVNYLSSMDSPYAGGNGYNFYFNDGRVFEIVVNHFPRRILI
jgi:hypothetical protein